MSCSSLSGEFPGTWSAGLKARGSCPLSNSSSPYLLENAKVYPNRRTEDSHIEVLLFIGMSLKKGSNHTVMGTP